MLNSGGMGAAAPVREARMPTVTRDYTPTCQCTPVSPGWPPCVPSLPSVLTTTTSVSPTPLPSLPPPGGTRPHPVQPTPQQTLSPLHSIHCGLPPSIASASLCSSSYATALQSVRAGRPPLVALRYLPLHDAVITGAGTPSFPPLTQPTVCTPLRCGLDALHCAALRQ